MGTFGKSAVLNAVNHSKPDMQTLVAIVLGLLAGEYLISRTLFALLGEANGNLYARHNWLFLWFGRKVGILIALWIVS